ncbi:MAG: hypothetical protein ACXAEU_02640 [Candidatus Hodarchaeales archaeon]|jgi:hypothetical protein
MTSRSYERFIPAGTNFHTFVSDDGRYADKLTYPEYVVAEIESKTRRVDFVILDNRSNLVRIIEVKKIYKDHNLDDNTVFIKKPIDTAKDIVRTMLAASVGVTGEFWGIVVKLEDLPSGSGKKLVINVVILEFTGSPPKVTKWFKWVELTKMIPSLKTIGIRRLNYVFNDAISEISEVKKSGKIFELLSKFIDLLS